MLALHRLISEYDTTPEDNKEPTTRSAILHAKGYLGPQLHHTIIIQMAATRSIPRGASAASGIPSQFFSGLYLVNVNYHRNIFGRS